MNAHAPPLTKKGAGSLATTSPQNLNLAENTPLVCSLQVQQPRSTNDGPWCWQRKDVLQLINDAFSESGNDHNRVISARSVYVALTELASDNGSETFTATKALIAYRAGVSVSTVERVLNGFEQLGIVRIERKLVKQSQGAINAPNTYTLLSLRPRDVMSLRQTVGERLPDKVKEKKERKENTPKGVHTIPTSGMALPSFSKNGREDSFSLYSEDEQQMIADYHRFIDIRREEYGEQWYRVNRYSDNVREALEIRGSPEEFRQFLQDALKDEYFIPDRHTLVRLCWQNY